MHSNSILAAVAAAGLLIALPAAAQEGFTDTPILPGQKWHVHDKYRPRPPVVKPGPAPAQPVAPPSDAIVLFDGKDLSKWAQSGRGEQKGQIVEPRWKVENGYFEVVGRTGGLFTREKFGDAQIHVEWQIPPDIEGKGQGRGNSGVLPMRRYEIQVLDSYENETYADGQAGAIYGQFPPLVNPARKPGEWQTYDIIFEAPRFDGDKLVKPAFFTIFFNGVLVQNHQESMGPVVYRNVAKYRPHAAEEPLELQDHGMRVRFRNIWVRRLSRDQAQ